MKHIIHWYVVTDFYGNKRSAVVDETCDTVQFHLFGEQNELDPTGEGEYFESEAYHLCNWCLKHGFKYEDGTMELDLPSEEDM